MLKAAFPCVPLFMGVTGGFPFHFRFVGGAGAERESRARERETIEGALAVIRCKGVVTCVRCWTWVQVAPISNRQKIGSASGKR